MSSGRSSVCKSPPLVRPRDAFLPAGLCKLLEIKNSIISYHPDVVSVLLSISGFGSVPLAQCCRTNFQGFGRPVSCVESQRVFLLRYNNDAGNQKYLTDHSTFDKIAF